MKITVNDCIKLDVFKEARVLAGRYGIERKVGNVTVLDTFDPDEIAKYADVEGNLVLTAMYGIREDYDAQCAVIRALSEHGASAVVLFHVGAVVERVGIEVMEQADKLDLPLIEMPDSAGVSEPDAAKAVMERMLLGDSFGNKLISNTIFHLLDFEHHTGFQDALRAAAVNNGFQFVLISDDFNPIFSVETRHRASIADAIRQGRERVSEHSPVYTMVDVDGVKTYWGPVTIKDQKYFMFIVDNDDLYTAAEITKLAEIIEISMGMWKYSPERDAVSEYIKALRRGNAGLARTLRQEAELPDKDILSVFYTKGMDPAAREKAEAEFVKRTGFRVIKVVEGDDFYGLINCGSGSDTADAAGRAECNSLYESMKGEKNVRIFHVTGVDGIEGACDAFRLISESWTFVQNVFPYKRVFTKYELTLVSNCINLQLQGGSGKKNYLELLEPFKEAGESKGRYLLETLETFVLDAGMNSAKTAEFLGIHTNTVQYRLKKINEVLTAEITGNRIIPGLTIALALKRLERVAH